MHATRGENKKYNGTPLKRSYKFKDLGAKIEKSNIITNHQID
jgi:hypothetical protein